jgi:hypothetical protein
VAAGGGAAGLGLPAQAAGAGAGARAAAAGGSRAVTGLRVNGVTASLGIQSAPVFSWIPQVAGQSAYEIEVGTAPGRADVWRSGRVAGSGSTAVPYEGAELASRRPYFWRVRAWDEHGRATGWSEPARWETGLLDGERAWAGARWIGGREPRDPSAAVNSKVPTGPDDTDLDPATLDHVAARLETVRGTVASQWRRTGGRIAMEVTVPHHTTAEIWVPARGTAAVSAPSGVRFPRYDTTPGGERYAVHRATAGTYRFTA